MPSVRPAKANAGGSASPLPGITGFALRTKADPPLSCETAPVGIHRATAQCDAINVSRHRAVQRREDSGRPSDFREAVHTLLRNSCGRVRPNAAFRYRVLQCEQFLMSAQGLQ